jgi:hypothetical protein
VRCTACIRSRWHNSAERAVTTMESWAYGTLNAILRLESRVHPRRTVLCRNIRFALHSFGLGVFAERCRHLGSPLPHASSLSDLAPKDAMRRLPQVVGLKTRCHESAMQTIFTASLLCHVSRRHYTRPARLGALKRSANGPWITAVQPPASDRR